MRATKTLLTAALLLGSLGVGEAEGQRPERERARREAARRGWIGVSVEAVRGEPRGEGWLRVTQVLPDSPAEQAGVEEGDTVVSWNGRSDAERALDEGRVEPGDTVRLRVRRGGRERDLAVVAEALPRRADEVIVLRPGELPRQFRLHADSLRVHADTLHQRLRTLMRDSLGPRLRALEDLDWPELQIRLRDAERRGPLAFDFETGQRAVAGAEFAPMNAGLAQYFGIEHGVLVLRVAPETPASRSGLRSGDVVVEVNDQPVDNVRDLRRAIGSAREREVKLDVVRKGGREEVRLRWER